MRLKNCMNFAVVLDLQSAVVSKYTSKSEINMLFISFREISDTLYFSLMKLVRCFLVTSYFW